MKSWLNRSLSMSSLLIAAMLIAVVLIAGCGPKGNESEVSPESAAVDPEAASSSVDERQWSEVAAEALTESQKAQQLQGMGARDALFAQLLDKLMRVISSTGPVAAISVCKESAPELAQSVSAEHGVAIGRTSFKLRNPANKVPVWAQAWVDERVDQPKFSAADDGSLAMLLPIKLKQECLMCHGAKDQMESQVVETIERLYPDDTATGFAEGDLRGWFWIEVPMAKESE